LNPQSIKAVTVLKNKPDIEKYGDKGKNGVIIIELKTPAERKLISLRKYAVSDSVKIKSLNNSRSFTLKGGNAIKGIENLDTRAIPYIVVDGVVVQGEDLNEIDSQNIESVTVLKGAQAISLYGKAAADGAIVIVTKVGGRNTKSTLKTTQFSAQSTSINKDAKSLTIYTPYKIDGMFGFTSKDDPFILVNNKRISEAEFNKLDPQTIKLIHVWNGNDAIEKYGKNAKNGVIDIVLKSAREMKLTEDELQNEMFPAANEQTSTSTWTSSKVSFSISIDKFTDAELEKFKVQLKNEGYEFKLRTFRKTGDKVTKLKFDLDGTAYTFEPNKGIKSLTITINNRDKEPKVSAVTY
jgi:TonB-dependent SusC/RagA subfamily outer membrane receptor